MDFQNNDYENISNDELIYQSNNLNFTNVLSTEYESNYSNQSFQEKIIDSAKKNKQIGNKRGRKSDSRVKKQPHDRNANDNIRKRIKTTFFNFLIIFFNSIFKSYLKNEELKYIPYQEKAKNTKKEINEQFLLPINEILQLDIQGNYKDKKHNFNLYQNKIKHIMEFQDFSKMKVYEFYENIYLKSDVYKKYLELLKKNENDLYFEKYKKLFKGLIDFANIKREVNLSFYDNILLDIYKNNYLDIFNINFKELDLELFKTDYFYHPNLKNFNDFE
jgi:hypothetical protein